LRLSRLAESLGLEVEGAQDPEIEGLASLEDAGPADLAFVTGPRYRRAFEATKAAAVLAPVGFDVGGRPCLRSTQPYADFARAVDLFHPETPFAAGVHETAVIGAGAELGDGVYIGPHAVVGERSKIGARTRLHANAVIYPDSEVGADSELHSGVAVRSRVRLGDRVVLHNGTVVGSEGFGFAFRADGTRIRVPHRCGVEIGDDTEIGANSTIDASHPGQAGRGWNTTWSLVAWRLRPAISRCTRER